MPRGWKKTKTEAAALLRRMGTLVAALVTLVGAGFIIALLLSFFQGTIVFSQGLYKTLHGPLTGSKHFAPFFAVFFFILLLLALMPALWQWLRDGVQEAWERAEGAWKKLSNLISSHLNSKKDSNEDSADEFWKKHSYRVIRVIAVFGVLLLSVATGLSIFYGEPGVATTASYFLVFIGAGVAAAIATWRGRQAERDFEISQREEQRKQFEKALEMATEKDNDVRNVWGILSLRKRRPFISIEEYARLYDSFASMLRSGGIKQDTFLEIYIDLWRKQISRGVEDNINKKMKAHADSLPSSRYLNALFRFLMYEEITKEKAGEENSSYVGKQACIFPSMFPWGNAWYSLPDVDMHGVAYVIPEAGSEAFTFPSKKMRVDQTSSFYLLNVINNSVLRYVNFSGSILHSVRFLNTDLEGAIFDRTHLCFATIADSSIQGASFVGTNITGANFTTAKEGTIALEQFKQSVWIAPKVHTREEMERIIFLAPKFPPAWGEKEFWDKNAYQGEKGWVGNYAQFCEELRADPEILYAEGSAQSDTPAIPPDGTMG